MIGSAIDRLSRNETLKRGVNSLASEDRLKRYQNVFSLAPAETIKGLFRDDVLPERQGHELVEYWHALRPQMEHIDELGGFQLLEIRSSLPDELLMYADKLSMAHSLEVRVLISKSGVALASGYIGRFARVTCRRASSNERSAALR